MENDLQEKKSNPLKSLKSKRVRTSKLQENNVVRLGVIYTDHVSAGPTAFWAENHFMSRFFCSKILSLKLRLENRKFLIQISKIQLNDAFQPILSDQKCFWVKTSLVESLWAILLALRKLVLSSMSCIEVFGDPIGFDYFGKPLLSCISRSSETSFEIWPLTTSSSLLLVVYYSSRWLASHWKANARIV